MVTLAESPGKPPRQSGHKGLVGRAVRKARAVLGCRPGVVCMTGWWAILDSNQGPQSYQDCALTV